MKKLLIVAILNIFISYAFSEEIYIEKEANIAGGEIVYDWTAYEGYHVISEEELYKKIGLDKVSKEIKQANKKYRALYYGFVGTYLLSSIMMIAPLIINMDNSSDQDFKYGSIAITGSILFLPTMVGGLWADSQLHRNKTPYTYAKRKLNEHNQ